MGFPSVPKSVTLNDLERRNGHYFALFYSEFDSFGSQLRKLINTALYLENSVRYDVS